MAERTLEYSGASSSEGGLVSISVMSCLNSSISYMLYTCIGCYVCESWECVLLNVLRFGVVC